MTDWRHSPRFGQPYEHPAADRSTGDVASVPGWRRRVTVVGVGDVDGVFVTGVRHQDLLGWSSAYLRCAPYGEWVHPDDREMLVESADRVGALTGRWFWPVEIRILARDRRYWWTRWHLWVSTGRCVVCASGVDYVGRDDVVGPPVGTWRWDIDADQVVWSTELLDMFGLGVGPPMSYQRFLDSVHDEDRDDVDQAVRWSLCSGDPFVADFRGVDDGERDRWFHAAGRVEPDAGGSRGQLCGIVKYLNPSGNCGSS